MLVGGLAELLTKVADGKEPILCLPGTENCFQPSAHYGIDGITEKVIATISHASQLNKLFVSSSCSSMS